MFTYWVDERKWVQFSQKIKTKNLQVKKKKTLLQLGGRGILNFLLHDLIPFKVTSHVLNEFFLVTRNCIPVTLRIGVGLIGKELICSFEVDGLCKSLSLGIDGHVRKIQVREGGFDLTEAVVKTVSKVALKLLQDGIEVTVLSHHFLLSLTEVTLYLQDLCLLVYKDLLQRLNMRLRLLQELLGQIKLINLNFLLSHQLPQLYIPRLNFLPQTGDHRLIGHTSIHKTFHHDDPLQDSKAEVRMRQRLDKTK